jgi:hypothetical protein
MSAINEPAPVLHPIRVKLVPSNLPEYQGKYLALTDSVRSADIEAICGNLRERGGFSGDPDYAAFNVRQFLKEAAFLLCDGFEVNLGYFSIHPRVGGAFDHAAGEHEAGRHPVTFAFRVRRPMRDLIKHIKVLVEGLADSAGAIDDVTDLATGSVNESITPGGVVTVSGRRLKVQGSDPACGVYLAPEGGGAAAPISLTGGLGMNKPSCLAALIPADIPEGPYKLLIRTQFTASGTLLTSPRTIESAATLSVENP